MNRRLAFADQAPAVVAKTSHPLRDRDFSQLMRRGAMQDQRADFVADPHDLEDALPAAIAGPLAVAATGPAIQHVGHEIAKLGAQRAGFGFGQRLLALLADQSHQALGDDHFKR